MADRHVVSVQRDLRGRTVSLCNPNESWSPISATAAIGHISSGLHRYFTGDPNKPRYLNVIREDGRRYLRSERDTEPVNNLDNLPVCDGANLLTGQFDVLVELSQDTINSVARMMHAAGVIAHQASVVVDGYVAILVLGAHSIDLQPTKAGTAAATTVIPYLCWLRPLYQLDDPGETGAGTVRAHVDCYTVQEDDDSLTLATDWSKTTANDITVSGPSTAVQALIMIKAVLTWARSAGGRYRVPDVAGFGTPINLSLRFVENTASKTAQFGLDLVQPAGQVFPAATDFPLRLALSGQWIAAKVLDAFRDQLGDLPPPHGQQEVDLGNGTLLTAIDVELGDNQLLIYGTVRVGIITAAFIVTVLLTGTNPQNIRASIQDVKVDVNNLLSAIADFFTAGAIRRAIADGVRSALRGYGSGGITDLLGRQILRSVAALGSTGLVRIDTLLDQMHITHAGVEFTGQLITAAIPPVRAQLDAQELANQWGTLLALDSWAPGSSIESVMYDFGDGTNTTLHGQQLALVSSHQYKAGRWRATVTISDGIGRTAQASRTINIHA